MECENDGGLLTDLIQEVEGGVGQKHCVAEEHNL